MSSKPTEEEWHANLAKAYGEEKATAIVVALKKAYPQKKIRTLSYMCSGSPGLNGLVMRNNVVKMARLKHERVTGALVEHLPSGASDEIQADLVIVAADALRTPQLLWTSGIRPRALGHYINDHLWTFSAVVLHEKLISQGSSTSYRTPANTVGVFQVPFYAPTHPYHGQVMHMDVSPVRLDGGEAHESKHVVGMGWSCQKQIRYEDCVSFSDTEVDYFGMPKMHFAYELTEIDSAKLAEAAKEQSRTGAALGTPVFSDEPLMVPPGTSLHYQGSVRMGPLDDGQSVCDSHSRVWGFSNLFIGGNGVIPTATACNPTLTSVAMAVRACDEIIQR